MPLFGTPFAQLRPRPRIGSSVASAPATPTYTLTKTCQIDNDYDSTTATGWNSWNATSGTPANISLLDPSGASLGWTGSSIGGWTANGNGNTTGNNSGVYPDQVLQSIWYNSTLITANPPNSITISGLDNTKTYDVTVMGSRGGTTNRGTLLQIGSDQRNQIADNNTSNTTTFAKVAPISGAIKLIVSVGTGSDGTQGGYGYITTMVLREYAQS